MISTVSQFGVRHPSSGLDLDKAALPSRRAGKPRQIEKRAHDLLERHPHFRGRSRWVRCRYINDCLCLVGCVPSYFLKQLAQEALREMKGTKIKNQLRVQSPIGNVVYATHSKQDSNSVETSRRKPR